MGSTGISANSYKYEEGYVVYQSGDNPKQPRDIPSNYFGSFALGDALDNKRRRIERLQDWLIGALVLSIVIVGAVIFVLQFPVPLRDPPVRFYSVTPPEQMSYCPGEIMTFTVDFEVMEPAIIGLYVSIEKENGDSVPGTTYENSVPKAEPIRLVNEEISRIMPELEPGKYRWITGVAGINGGSEPAFHVIPFEIREDCSNE